MINEYATSVPTAQWFEQGEWERTVFAKTEQELKLVDQTYRDVYYTIFTFDERLTSRV